LEFRLSPTNDLTEVIPALKDLLSLFLLLALPKNKPRKEKEEKRYEDGCGKFVATKNTTTATTTTSTIVACIVRDLVDMFPP